MKSSLVFLLVLCHLCSAEEHSTGGDISIRAPAEGGGQEQDPEPQSDIWAELRVLRDMVVEHRVELIHMRTRVTAAEIKVKVLQEENAAMEAWRKAAESLTEELQMENDAQATELADAQKKINSMQQRLTASEQRVQELETQQEGHRAALQELQNAEKVRKVAFSASLLESGEGLTTHEDGIATLIYRNVIANTGNHYNSNTGYFTAPVRGVYYFTFTGHLAHSDLSMMLRLVKNEELIVFSGDRHTTAEDVEDNSTNGAVLQLEVGDVVSVQLSGRVWDDQYHRTTFSGFLVYPL